MTVKDAIKRHPGATSVLFALLVSAGPALAQSDPVKVTISSARAVVYRFQTVKLRVTIENQGTQPTAALKREQILGDKNFLCAAAGMSPEIEREGVWAKPAGPALTGTIGSPIQPR